MVLNEEHEINYTVITGLSLATAQIVANQPDAALGTLDRIDWSRSVWDSSDIIRAVALIDTGLVAEAADLVVGYGRAALRGRLSRQSNDALVGLAAMALHRGESDHAWDLLLQAVTPRTPFTIALAEAIAHRLDRGDELRSIHREREIPLADLDAADHLRTELDRLTAD